VDKLKPAFDLTLSTYSLESIFTSKPAGSFLWKGGITGMRQYNYREGAFLIPGYNLTGGGLFWIGSISHGKWGFESGLRLDGQHLDVFPVRSKNIDRQQKAFANMSASASAVYTIDDHSSFGITAGQTWRPPAINELFSDGVHHGTAQYETGNPDLQSEISRSVDLTYKHEDGIHHVEVSTYLNRLSGFIYARPSGVPVLTVRGAFPAFSFTQTDALITGIELLLESQVREHLLLTFAGSALYGQNLSENEALLFMPAPRIATGLHYDFLELGNTVLFVESNVRHVFRQTRFPDGVDYLDPPAAYSLASFALGSVKRLKTGEARFTLSIENLFNRQYRDYQSRYRYFIDEPGRNIMFRWHHPF
jgi:iron complex outermembrane receptor protein